MIEAPHFSPVGAKKKGDFALPAELFDGSVNEPAMHQVVKAYLNNQRQGTHMTKTRSFVSGGNQKPWKQKGTGRARQGSIRAPHWRGGGIVFGPQPRDYYTDVPRKLKQLARKSALNARAATGALVVVEQFQFAGPKTSQLAELLEKLSLTGKKVLLLTHGTNHAVYLSGRNIPLVRVMNYADVSAYDALWSDAVVVEEGAFGGEPPAPWVAPEGYEAPRKMSAPRPKKTAKARPTPKAEKAAPRAKKPKTAKAKAGTKKPATKKSAAKKPAPKKKGGK
jgi:large subunit ribosomal protein L4